MGAGPAGMMAMSVFSMGSGFMPGMRPGAPKVTYVWGLPGRKSARELTDTNPMFELNYGEIPGVDPDAYEPALLKLVQSKDNYRLVGATQIKMDAKPMMAGSNPENGKWISEDRWPSRVDKEERGFYILHVNSAARARRVRGRTASGKRIQSGFFRTGRPRSSVLFRVGFQRSRRDSRAGWEEKEEVIRPSRRLKKQHALVRRA